MNDRLYLKQQHITVIIYSLITALSLPVLNPHVNVTQTTLDQLHTWKAKCLISHEALNFKMQNVTLCCLVRVITL